jgi:heat shock protein HslJ
MKKIITAVMLSVLIFTGISACSTLNSTLEDTRWFLRSYGEQNNLQALIEDTEITATFDSAKGQVSGSAGCNTYFAGYEVQGSKLSIFEMAWTEMACLSPEGVMEQEQEYLTILANAQSFQADDTTLTIFCSGGQQLYFTTATR